MVLTKVMGPRQMTHPGVSFRRMEDGDVISFLCQRGAVALLLDAGEPPRLRARDGRTFALDLPCLDARAVAEFAQELMSARERGEFEQAGEFRRERKWPNREHGLRIEASPGRASFGWDGPC